MKKKMLFFKREMSLFFVLLMSLFLTDLSGQCVIKSNDESTSSGFVSPGAGSFDIGNSFTACQSGIISKIKILSLGDRQNISLTIYEGNGVTGSLLKTIQNITLRNATNLTDYSVLDVSSLNISVSDGVKYTFFFTGGVLFYYNDGSSGDMYSGGTYWVDDPELGIAEATNRDLYFEIELVNGTANSAPVVTTQDVSNVLKTTATGNGTITDLGSSSVTQYGVCWNLTGNPTITDDKTTEEFPASTGAFTSSITGLTPATKYYVKAYATNGTGITYGDEKSFTTQALPLVAFTSTSSQDYESVSSADLQVNLSAMSDDAISVDYSVSGTATGSDDYTLSDGTLDINAGEESGIITITNIVDDMLNEESETVIVTLSNPVNATLGTNTTYTYTILDNDPITGINARSINGIMLSPNPFSDYIKVDGDQISHVFVSDLLGNMLFSVTGSASKLNTSDLPGGVYLISVEKENGERSVFKMKK